MTKSGTNTGIKEKWRLIQPKGKFGAICRGHSGTQWSYLWRREQQESGALWSLEEKDCAVLGKGAKTWGGHWIEYYEHGRVRYPKKPFGTATESDGITLKMSDKEEGDYEFDVSVYEKRKGSYLIRLEMHEENMHQAFSIV